MSRTKPVMIARLSAAEPRHRQLDRELGAVGAQAGQLELPPGERAVAVGHVRG